MFDAIGVVAPHSAAYEPPSVFAAQEEYTSDDAVVDGTRSRTVLQEGRVYIAADGERKGLPMVRVR